MKQAIVSAALAGAVGLAAAGTAVKVEPTPTPGASSPRAADAAKPAPKTDKKEAPKK